MAPRTLEDASRPVGDPNQVYVFTTGQDVHQASLDDYGQNPREPWSWTAQRDMRRGAYFLLYVAYPISAFCWIGRACSDAEQPASAQGRSCLWVEMHPLPEPLSLAEAREHDVIGTWRAIAGNAQLQGGSRRVLQPEAWDALITVLGERNPEVGALLGHWRDTPPPTPTESLEDFFWEGGPGWDYPFHRERPLQEGVRDYFVEQEGYRSPVPEDGRWLKDLEARLGDRSRADILLVAEDEVEPTLLVIETKVFAVSPAGVEQLKRYAEWIEKNEPGWCLRRILCAQEFSESAFEAAAAEAVECWKVGWPDADEVLDGSDWVIGPVGVTDLPSQEELERRARLASEQLKRASGRRRMDGEGDSPNRPGLLAYWAASPEASEVLGLKNEVAARPLWVSATPHVRKALASPREEIGGFKETLRLHLSIACRVIPWWWHVGNSEDPLGHWAYENIVITWAETDDPPAIRRMVAAALQPTFHDLNSGEVEVLRRQFRPKIVRGILATDAVIEWTDWLEDCTPEWIQADPDVGIAIMVDEDGLPLEWRSGRPASGRCVFVSAEALQDPHGELRRLRPDAAESPTNQSDWEAAIRDLTREDALVRLATVLARPLIDLGTLR